MVVAAAAEWGRGSHLSPRPSHPLPGDKRLPGQSSVWERDGNRGTGADKSTSTVWLVNVLQGAGREEPSFMWQLHEASPSLLSVR